MNHGFAAGVGVATNMQPAYQGTPPSMPSVIVPTCGSDRQPQVHISMSINASRLDELTEKIARLTERLGPVTISTPKQDPSPLPLQPIRSGLAQSLFEQGMVLDRITADVDLLLGSLDL